MSTTGYAVNDSVNMNEISSRGAALELLYSLTTFSVKESRQHSQKGRREPGDGVFETSRLPRARLLFTDYCRQ